MAIFEKVAFLKKKNITNSLFLKYCLKIQFEVWKWVLVGKIQFRVTSVLCFQFQKPKENLENGVFLKDAFLRRKKKFLKIAIFSKIAIFYIFFTFLELEA